MILSVLIFRQKHSEDQRLNISTDTKKSNAVPSTSSVQDVNPQLTINCTKGNLAFIC